MTYQIFLVTLYIVSKFFISKNTYIIIVPKFREIFSISILHIDTLSIFRYIPKYCRNISVYIDIEIFYIIIQLPYQKFWYKKISINSIFIGMLYTIYRYFQYSLPPWSLSWNLHTKWYKTHTNTDFKKSATLHFGGLQITEIWNWKKSVNRRNRISCNAAPFRFIIFCY